MAVISRHGQMLQHMIKLHLSLKFTHFLFDKDKFHQFFLSQSYVYLDDLSLTLIHTYHKWFTQNDTPHLFLKSKQHYLVLMPQRNKVTKHELNQPKHNNRALSLWLDSKQELSDLIGSFCSHCYPYYTKYRRNMEPMLIQHHDVPLILIWHFFGVLILMNT